MKAIFKSSYLPLLAITGILSLTVVSCKKDDPVVPPASNTVTDVVVNGADFSTLEAAVVKAGLAATLSGPGPFTVFAPDNAAFAASGITSIDGLSADALKKILLYHTLGAKALAADLPTAVNTKYTTVEIPGVPADSIFVTKTTAGAVFINGVQVTEANISVDNGVIHKIGRVLLPPTGTLVATVVAANDGDDGLDSLERAVVRVPGLAATLNSNTLTVFAPTNKAFRNLLGALGASNIDQIDLALLGTVLGHHVVVGRAFSSALSNGQSIPMFAAGNSTISITAAGAFIKGAGATSATAKIIATDIMCTRAVVHKIDAVILP